MQEELRVGGMEQLESTLGPLEWQMGYWTQGAGVRSQLCHTIARIRQEPQGKYGFTLGRFPTEKFLPVFLKMFLSV